MDFTLTSANTNVIVRRIISDTANNIYVGGNFTNVGNDSNNISVYSIAKYNDLSKEWSIVASNDSDLSGATVYTLIVDNTHHILYVSYVLATIGYVSKCVLTASLIVWTTLITIGVNKIIYTLELDSSNNLYFGGTFTTVNGTIGYKNVGFYNYSTELFSNMSGGLSHSGSTLPAVRVLKYHNSNIYAGGNFTKSSINCNNLAYWNGSAWFDYYGGTQSNAATDIIYDITFDNSDNLFICGNFAISISGGLHAHCFAYYNNTSSLWETYGTGLTNSSGGITGVNVYSLYYDLVNSRMYAGGTFRNSNTLNNFAYWSGSNWLTAGSGVTNTVGTAIIYSLCNTPDYLFIGGDFNMSNTTGLNKLAIYDKTYNTIGPNISCLCEDTDVLTPDGYVNIKLLKIGDIILTDDERKVKIKNISISSFKSVGRNVPYLIKANSIDKKYPPKDVNLSAYHLIKYNDKWILPKIINNIKEDESDKIVTYYHIKLENYLTDNLVVNYGCIVESLGDKHNEDHANLWRLRFNQATESNNYGLIE